MKKSDCKLILLFVKVIIEIVIVQHNLILRNKFFFSLEYDSYLDLIIFCKRDTVYYYFFWSLQVNFLVEANQRMFELNQLFPCKFDTIFEEFVTWILKFLFEMQKL